MAEWLPKYYCNYCQEHITDIRVKCTECSDFDLCLQCFSSAAEIGNHRNTHGYQLDDSCSFPVFNANESPWKAREELAMLDSIEHYGYGNWEDPCKALDGARSVEAVKQHFEDYYIQGNIGKATWNNESIHIAKDHTSAYEGPLSPSLSIRLSSTTDVTNFEKIELGYMPKRDDFEREFDNDAESLVSNLTTTNEDEDIDISLKLAHVDVYIRQLKERQRRKNIVRNHDLVNVYHSSISNKLKTPNSKTKRSSRDEKELKDKFQPFAQYQTLAEFQRYFENLKKEKELKIRIKELIRYRRNGITKLKDCSDYESIRYKRDRRKENYHRNRKTANLTSHRIKSLSTATKNVEGGKNQTISQEKSEENDEELATRKLDNITSSSSSSSVITATTTTTTTTTAMKTSNDSIKINRLLSSKEKKLCSSIGIKPSFYMTFKTVLLKDYQHLSKENFGQIPTPKGINKNHRNKILNFFVQSGWLSTL